MANLEPIRFPQECLTELFDSYQEQFQQNIKVSGFESGFKTTRLRSCFVYKLIAIRYLACSKEAYDKFLEFYKDTTRFGSKYFLWTNPCSGKDERVRFTAGPQAVPLDPCLERWEITVSFETICY